jgi:hypothetical protein
MLSARWANSIQLRYQPLCASRIANVRLAECLSEGSLLNVHKIQGRHRKRYQAETKADPVRER